MKISLWITGMMLSLVFCLVAKGNPNSQYHFARTVQGQKLSVILEIGPFDAIHHDIKHTGTGVLVDGSRPMGNDGDSTASTEFKRFVISWNGNDIHLVKASYSPIFNVPLKLIVPGESSTSGFAIIPSQDGRALLFYFRSEGGPTPEQVWLVVDSSGKWKRFHSWDIFEKGGRQ